MACMFRPRRVVPWQTTASLPKMMARLYIIVFAQLTTAMAQADSTAPSANAEEDNTNLVLNLMTSSLGQHAFLGELYDCKDSNSSLMGSTLWPLDLLEDERYVQQTPAASAAYTFTSVKSLKDKMKLLNVQGEIFFKKTFAGGMTLEVSGSGKYLDESPRSNRVAQSSVAQLHSIVAD